MPTRTKDIQIKAFIYAAFAFILKSLLPMPVPPAADDRPGIHQIVTH